MKQLLADNESPLYTMKYTTTIKTLNGVKAVDVVNSNIEVC